MDRSIENLQTDSHQPQLALRERKKRDTAELIYRAALRLFREHGYAATTVEEIAQAASVDTSTFFKYYPTKDAVLSHLGRQQMRLVEEAIALIADFDKLPSYGQSLFIFNLLAAGVQGDRDFLRIVTVAHYNYGRIHGRDFAVNLLLYVH
jgi:AcrR family transcriptional regulator